MSHNLKPEFKNSNLKLIPIAIVLGIIWLIFIGGFLWWGIHSQQESTYALAAAEARAAVNKDLAYRRWSADQGGIYVPISSSTPPSPYLSHIKERDISTPSGEKLTLINPAYMTRQVHELGNQQYGVKGHITSLKPIRPENRPDEWEVNALNAFERGESEISSLVKTGDTEYFRLMRPMLAEEGCLKCHGYQGYKVGDLRGGISVSVPLTFYKSIEAEGISRLSAVYMSILLVGYICLFLSFFQISKKSRERDLVENKLRESESHLRTIFNASQDGIYDWDLVTNDIYYSPGWKRMLGYENSELTNDLSTWEELTEPGDVKLAWEMQKELITRKRDRFEIEFKMKHKNGSWVDILSRATAIFDDNGNAVRFVGTHVDITERRKTENAKRDREKKYRTILKTAIDGFWIADVKEKILEVNDAYCRMSGYSKEELLAMRVSDIEVGETPEEVTAHIEQAKKIGSGYFETIHRKKDGTPYHVEVNFTYLPMDGGGFVSFVKDITERKNAEHVLIESEQKFKGMFKDAPLSYQSLDAHGNFTEVNKAWLKTLGYVEDEVIGKNFCEFLAPGWAEHFQKNFPEFKDAGEILGVEFELVKKDRSTIQVSFHGKIGKDHHGNFKQTHCVFNDISLQKYAESTLKRDLELNRAIAEISKELLSESYDIKKVSDAVLDAAKNITGSEHGIVSSIDPKTLDNVGHTLTDMFGDACRIKDHKVAFPIGEDGVYGGLWGHGLNTKKAFFTNTPEAHPSSTGIPEGHIPLRNYMAVPVLINDRLLGLIALSNSDQGYSIENINSVERIAEMFALALHRQEYESQRSIMERSLRQLQKKEAIGSLAGGIAHDFNNILFPIVGFAELLQEDIPEDSPLMESVNEIIIGAKRAKELVKQILTFSRQSEQEIKPLKPHLIIKEVFKLIKSTLPTTIEIRQNIDPGCKTIMADPTQIHQVAMNLITNAYHAMQDSGGVLSVTLKNVRLDEYLEDLRLDPGQYILLSIEDTGIGMKKSTIEKIFDPYFSTKTKDKGTGLGLSVVQGIVNSYGGKIEVISTPGRGTVFNVYLPTVVSYESQQITSEQSSDPGGNEHILLVDDEKPILRIEQMLLERLGYQVAVAETGKEALLEIQSHPRKYDLIITDMTMPKMTGDVLAQEIKLINPDLPIMICTGFSEKLTPEKASSIGIGEILAKPIIKKDLAQAIRRLLD